MTGQGWLVVGLGLFGGLVGHGLAILSVWLPDEIIRPRGRRHLTMAAAGGVVGIWAATVGDAQGLLVAVTAMLGWQLLLIAVVDAEHLWLPDALTWPLAGSGLMAAAAMQRAVPWDQLVGVAVGFGGLWLLAWIYRRIRGRQGLGGGDPFLLAGAGAWVGWTGLPMVLLAACGVGFCVVMVRLLLRRPVRGADRLPFGTYLAAGVWIAWLMGLRGG